MIKQIVKIIQRILIPIGILYGIIMQIRNWFYDWGIFKSVSFDVPVVSVGNITAGGTGKTPFTIFLAGQLAGQFKKIAIVSRGYGRESRGVQLVAADGQLYLHATEAGDEPFLIAQSLPGAIVIVSEERAEGIRFALNKFQADLIILDDAFQHRSVKRDLDILLINAKDSWQGNFPIPGGTLREFKFNHKRAGLIVFTNTDANSDLPFIPASKPFFTSNPRLKDVIDLENKVIGKIEDFQTKKVLAFAGIAHPDNFFSSLETQNVNPISTVAFRDHYSFKNSDIDRLVQQADKAGTEALLCTEKDLVKIQKLQKTGTEFSILAVRLGLYIDQPGKLIAKVVDSI